MLSSFNHGDREEPKGLVRPENALVRLTGDDQRPLEHGFVQLDVFAGGLGVGEPRRALGHDARDLPGSEFRRQAVKCDGLFNGPVKR